MKTANQIIDELGGTSAVAKMCDINPSAVSQWRSSPNGIPKCWLKFFSAIRPEVFKTKSKPTKKAA